MAPYQIVDANPPDGCSAERYKTPIKGKFALIQRGNCGFTDKVLVAQKLGAVGVIIVNTDKNIMRMMGDPAVVNKINIPSAMVTPYAGSKLKEAGAYGKFVEDDFTIDYEV